MTRSIVSNTGPLIALASISQLDLLRELFTSTIVPREVHREVLDGGPESTGVGDYEQAGWIEIQDLECRPDPLLLSLLDAGEAAVIQMALQSRVNRVLIDERKARRIARDVYRLDVIGTAGLLVQAREAGLIDNVKAPLEAMRKRGYYIHERIVRRAIEQSGE